MSKGTMDGERLMKLSEIKRDWTFIPLGGATNYWVEQIDAGPSNTIGPKRVLEIGCQLESENEKLRVALDDIDITVEQILVFEPMLYRAHEDVVLNSAMKEAREWRGKLDALKEAK